MCYRTGEDANAEGVAISEIAEILFFSELTLSSKGVSSPLWDRTPSGKEELVNALGHITSHSLPLGSPSLARVGKS